MPHPIAWAAAAKYAGASVLADSVSATVLGAGATIIVALITTAGAVVIALRRRPDPTPVPPPLADQKPTETQRLYGLLLEEKDQRIAELEQRIAHLERRRPR